MTSIDQSLAEIQSTVHQFYASSCYRNGEKLDLGKIKSFFLPGALLVNNNGSQPEVTIIEDLQIDQSLSEFYEGEIGQLTEVFGKVAMRFSAYEAKSNYNSTEPTSRGLNNFQLVKVNEKWFIASLTWYTETADLKLPSKYL